MKPGPRRAISAKIQALEAKLEAIQADTTAVQAEQRREIDALIQAYLDELADLPEEEETTKIRHLRAVAAEHGIMSSVIPASPRAVLPTVPSPTADRAELPTPPPTSSGDKILVVDDDEDALETLTEILGAEGYRVWRARDGIEGLRRLFEMPRCDLILLDLEMPRAGGLAFLEVFEKTPYSGTPVVIISGWRPPVGTLDDRFLYLSKPLDLPRLLSTVRRNVEMSRRQRA